MNSRNLKLSSSCFLIHLTWHLRTVLITIKWSWYIWSLIWTSEGHITTMTWLFSIKKIMFVESIQIWRNMLENWITFCSTYRCEQFSRIYQRQIPKSAHRWTSGQWPVSLGLPPHQSERTLINCAKTQNTKSHVNKTRLNFICLYCLKMFSQRILNSINQLSPDYLFLTASDPHRCPTDQKWARQWNMSHTPAQDHMGLPCKPYFEREKGSRLKYSKVNNSSEDPGQNILITIL